MTLAQGSRSMQMAQTVALLMDGPAALEAGGPSRAEIGIAAAIASEGRSLVVIANKTDSMGSPAEWHRVCDTKVLLN